MGDALNFMTDNDKYALALTAIAIISVIIVFF